MVQLLRGRQVDKSSDLPILFVFNTSSIGYKGEDQANRGSIRLWEILSDRLQLLLYTGITLFDEVSHWNVGFTSDPS